MSESTALQLAEWIEGDMSCQGDAEIAAELRRLHELNRELLEALQRSRAQWIHSVNAEFCLAVIEKAEGKV